MQYCIVTTTTYSKEESIKITKEVLNKKLAACVQCSEIESSYFWEGKIEHNLEYKLDFKTSKEKAKELIDFIKSIHSYKVPEIIVTPIIDGNIEYFKWIDESIK